MDEWDEDYLDLVEPAFIRFDRANHGEFLFGTVHGWLDCRHSKRDGLLFVEFSWEGVSDIDPACGRGWASRQADGSLIGHIYVHLSDDSAFKAE